jgi:hypothetical protein
MRNVLVFALLFASACKMTGNDGSEFSSFEGQGDAWQFANCKEQVFVGTETQVSPGKSYAVFLKVERAADNRAVDIIFTENTGEEYQLKADKPHTLANGKQVYWGRSVLSNAVALDATPLIIAYEPPDASNGGVEVIATKMELPKDYLDGDVTQGYEVHKYNSRGDAVVYWLLKKGTDQYDVLVSATCGNGFGFEISDARKRVDVATIATEVQIGAH